MKKLIILCVFLLVGCTSSAYDIYVNELKNVQDASLDYPFDIRVNVDKITEDELIYQLVIDNIKQPLENVKALIIHDQTTEDIFPSLGIMDDSINIDQTKKGIILVGYLPNKKYDEIEFKVLIEYNNQKQYYIYKYRQNS